MFNVSPFGRDSLEYRDYHFSALSLPSSFILAEKAFRAKWEAASAKFLSEDKRAGWHLNKLKRHRSIKEATTTDPDQQQREETLNDLLRKADHFPQVSQ